MIVFIFSNTYLTRAAIYFFELLFLKRNVFKGICILSDNHAIDEFSENLKNKLIIKSTFEECLELSDFCLFIKDQNYSTLKVDLLLSIAQKKELPCYFIQMADDTEPSISELLRLKCNPTILVLNYGEYTQQYCTEIALAHAFYKRKIGVFQRFSPFTDQFIKKMQNIIPFATNVEFGEKISIISYPNPLFDNYENDNKIREIIHCANPQYVILTTNNGVEITTEMKKHIYYLYGVNIDCIVQSVFTPLLIANKTIPLLTNCSSDSNALFAEDPYIAEKLFEKIEQKLIIPNGIHVI